MAQVASKLWMPGIDFAAVVLPSFAAMTIDAANEKVAFIGHVWNKDRTSKNITKVGFMFGTVVKAAGSGLTVSLQNVDAVNGPTLRPDGTQDQTVAIANGDAGFASDVWYQTGALSASRTVTHGELLAVVIEFDGSGWLTPDSVGIKTLSTANAYNQGQNGAFLYTTSWAHSHSASNVILEFDDGTFGTLEGSIPTSAVASTGFHSGTTPDEVGMEFTLPFPCTIDGASILINTNNAANNFDIVLYNGTTAQATVSVDANAVTTTGSRAYHVGFPPVTYTLGDTFRLVVKPTTAGGNTLLYYRDVANANHRQALGGGTSWAYVTRTDAGSWDAVTTTRQPFMGIRIASVDDGVGSGVTARVIGG